jgi:hypothetical protein
MIWKADMWHVDEQILCLHVAQAWDAMWHLAYGMLKCYGVYVDQTSVLPDTVEYLRKGQLLMNHALVLVNYMFSKLFDFDCVAFWAQVWAGA